MNIGMNSYKDHFVFQKLTTFAEFYERLAFSIFPNIAIGTSGIINIDTYLFSSIQGTLNSIKEILEKGRINDSYTLLRKYQDSTIINVYTLLYLEDNRNIKNFIVEAIDDWVKGKIKLPEYRIMSRYIQENQKVKIINDLVNKDQRYKLIRNRCNDHTHYNYYMNVLLNDGELALENRGELFSTIAKDIEDLFIAYLFYIKDYYMMSSDYLDSLEMGLEPEKDSQYFVASYIQKIFDECIKVERSDIALAIKENTSMLLK